MMGKIFMKHGETDTQKGLGILKQQMRSQMNPAGQQQQNENDDEWVEVGAEGSKKEAN